MRRDKDFACFCWEIHRKHYFKIVFFLSDLKRQTNEHKHSRLRGVRDYSLSYQWASTPRLPILGPSSWIQPKAHWLFFKLNFSALLGSPSILGNTGENKSRCCGLFVQSWTRVRVSNFRDGSLYQIGWILGKIPNSLRPPPQFFRKMSERKNF